MSMDIQPEIKDLTNRIVWNKEMMARYAADRKKLDDYYIQLGKTNKDKQGLSEVKSKIEGQDLQIQKHQARIDDLNSHLKKYGDHPHIIKGMTMAQTNLQKQKEAQMGEKDKSKIKDTLVGKSLNPEFMHQEIIVPPSPGEKKVELSSNADGGGAKSSTVTVPVGLSMTTKVVIGVAVLGVAYVLAKKYKYI